jgi:hypothetical protein
VQLAHGAVLNREEEFVSAADKMSGLEKFGINILRKVGQAEMSRAQRAQTVGAACDGKLHYLTDEQRSKVFWTHVSCVFQAWMIGLVCTAIPGLLESFWGITFETDGAVEAYWTCPGTENDPWGEPSVFVAPYDVLDLPTCPFGTCTSLPANITEYLAHGGHATNGGNWTNLATGLVGDCGLTDSADCIEANWAPQMSCAEETIRWYPCLKLREGRDRDLNCSPLPATNIESERFVYFTLLNFVGIGIGVGFEIFFLMSTAVRSAVLVSKNIDIKLTPLNEDRASVAKMLVRAVFDIGDDEGEMMGYVPKSECHTAGCLVACQGFLSERCCALLAQQCQHGKG